VAGAKLLVTDQMPDERRKTRIKRPASHTTLDGSLFIACGGEEMQEDVDDVESGGLGSKGRPEFARIFMDQSQNRIAADSRGFSRIKGEWPFATGSKAADKSVRPTRAETTAIFSGLFWRGRSRGGE